MNRNIADEDDERSEELAEDARDDRIAQDEADEKIVGELDPWDRLSVLPHERFGG